MKIKIEKNLVEFAPETAQETASLEALWRLMVDCVKFNKKMVPIGEYIPQKNNSASFMIEGLEIDHPLYPEIQVDHDCRCYCMICNRFVDLKKGDKIPPCCGQLMEIVD